MRIQKRKVILFSVALAVAVLSQVFMQLKNQEINFCRGVFAQLVKGSSRAAAHIDWDNFQALDIDVGANYRALAESPEKDSYKKAFIKGFALGFSRLQGNFRAFSRWRIYERADKKVVVASDYLGYNRTLIFTVSEAGPKRKLIALDWRN